MSEQQYLDTAKNVIEAIGGKDNLQAATHCATRLRLVLKDESKINYDVIDKDDLIKGNFLTAGQFQLIIGTGTVNKVYNELIGLTGAQQVSKSEAKDLAGEKGNFFQRAIKALSDIFVPIIPAIVAGGLLMAINNLLTTAFFNGRTQTLMDLYPQFSALQDMLNSFANAPFIYLPVLIAFSATRVFGGNAFLGAALGMIMVHPGLMNFYEYANGGTPDVWNLAGLEMEKVGYQGTVLPILVMSWVLAKLENFFHKVVPAALDLIISPLFALFITAFITFALTGPFLREMGDALAYGLNWLYHTGGAIGAAIFGFFYAPIVITGMHQSFPAIELSLLADVAKTGGTFIFPIAAMSNMAQGGAALAAMRTTKDEKLKGVASAGGISAILGITEPAMFGVNLKLRYPFYAAISAAAIAAGVIGLTKTKAVALGAAGIPGIASMPIDAYVPYIIGMCVAFFGAFAGTLALSKSKFNSELHEIETEGAVMPSVSKTTSTPTANPVTAAANTVTNTVSSATNTVADTASNVVNTVKDSAPVAAATGAVAATAGAVASVVTGKPAVASDWVMPVQGQVVPLSEVPDPAFSSGAMGAGFGINPTGGQVVSPVAGTVTAIFPTKHAVCIETADGQELLIHVGVDTVSLDGEGFTALVTDGQQVQAGTPLLDVDWATIRAKAPSAITPVLFTNMDDGEVIEIQDGKPVVVN